MMTVSQNVADFKVLKRADVIWIDLFSPEGDEKRATEKFLDTEIQSRAQAEEIEIIADEFNSTMDKLKISTEKQKKSGSMSWDTPIFH